MKNSERIFLTKKNPSIFILVYRGKEMRAVCLLFVEGFRIFKSLDEGHFYVETYPQEGEIVNCIQRSPGKHLDFAKRLAILNANAERIIQKHY